MATDAVIESYPLFYYLFTCGCGHLSLQGLVWKCLFCRSFLSQVTKYLIVLGREGLAYTRAVLVG